MARLFLKLFSNLEGVCELLAEAYKWIQVGSSSLDLKYQICDAMESLTPSLGLV